jgi:hypothetical protein
VCVCVCVCVCFSASLHNMSAYVNVYTFHNGLNINVKYKSIPSLSQSLWDHQGGSDNEAPVSCPVDHVDEQSKPRFPTKCCSVGEFCTNIINC